MSGYLVLSRKAGERVMIGDDITVTVVRMGYGQVKLAFKAPDGVAIDREERRIRISTNTATIR